MNTQEHDDLPSGLRYLRNSLVRTKAPNRDKALHTWELILSDAASVVGQKRSQELADIIFQTNIERKQSHSPRTFDDFIVLVGHQGSGKDYIANALVHGRRYTRITMSDIVRSVADALGYSPDTTQGKIDAGHNMRQLFGRSVLMDLCIEDANERGLKKIVVVGPRSMYEVRAARSAGARIVGLIAHPDRKRDTAIRSERVVRERPSLESSRKVTKVDFISRERQEYRRVQTMLEHADRIVVTNRNAADIADMLIPGYTGVFT